MFSTRSVQSAKPPVPVFLFDVVKTIRSMGGSIWLIDKQDYGTLFRIKIGKTSCWVVVPSPFNEERLPVPVEKGSLLFIVQSLNDLKTWLSGLIT